jgi:hypothetical protein
VSIDDTAVTCTRWGVTVDQYNAARPLVKQIRAQIRAESKLEAERLEGWLFDHDLAALSRPDRRQATRDFHGARQWSRDAAGYDFLEQLTDHELARIRLRMVDGDLYRPDLLAEQVRRKIGFGGGWTDGQAIAWLVDRWLTADALRSLASGRIPKYGNPADLLPATLALDGYQLEQLIGVPDVDAACHVAAVLAEAEQHHWRTALGVPIVGPAPWVMDANDYVAELEALTAFLEAWQVVPGVAADPVHTAARARLAELVPPELDYSGCGSDYDVHEVIRWAALTVGLLEPAPVQVTAAAVRADRPVNTVCPVGPGGLSGAVLKAGVTAGPWFGAGAGRERDTVATVLVPSWQRHLPTGPAVTSNVAGSFVAQGGPLVTVAGWLATYSRCPHGPNWVDPTAPGPVAHTSDRRSVFALVGRRKGDAGRPAGGATPVVRLAAGWVRLAGGGPPRLWGACPPKSPEQPNNQRGGVGAQRRKNFRPEKSGRSHT